MTLTTEAQRKNKATWPPINFTTIVHQWEADPGEFSISKPEVREEDPAPVGETHVKAHYFLGNRATEEVTDKVGLAVSALEIGPTGERQARDLNCPPSLLWLSTPGAELLVSAAGLRAALDSLGF